MPRKKRVFCNSEIYHVILRGNNKQIIFLNDSDRIFFLSRIKKYAELELIEIYTYCLMDNHIHILIGKANQGLSKFIQRLATSYAMYFNRKYERTGHLFQGRFKSEPVETTEYFKTVTRYILQNPVKAGLSTHIDYKWNSYTEIVNDKSPTVCHPKVISDYFGGIKNFIAFTNQINSDKCMEYENCPFFSDLHCIQFIKNYFGISSPDVFRKEGPILQKNNISILKQHGFSINQISRITGIARKVIIDA